MTELRMWVSPGSGVLGRHQPIEVGAGAAGDWVVDGHVSISRGNVASNLNKDADNLAGSFMDLMFIGKQKRPGELPPAEWFKLAALWPPSARQLVGLIMDE
jgi:hypothetical protein